MGPEGYFQFIQQTLKLYETASYVCGAIVIPIGLLYIGAAWREMARERGISLSSRLLTFYLDLTRGFNRALDPREINEITRSDLAKRV